MSHEKIKPPYTANKSLSLKLVWYGSEIKLKFNGRSICSIKNFDWGKNIVIFGLDMSSSVHADNKTKNILVLGQGNIKGLDDTTVTAEAKYSINFSRPNRKFCLSLHCNGANSYLFVDGTEVYKFKAKHSEIKTYPLCLGNVLIDISASNMIKTGLNGIVYDFSVDYDVIDTINIINIHKYLMKKHGI